MDDDHYQPEKTITDRIVKFEPWLVTFGILISTVATGLAAWSAHSSYKQIEATRTAVDQASRNQAFSDYLEALSNLCAVSLSPLDQDDFAGRYYGSWQNEETSQPQNYAVLQVNIDDRSSFAAANVDAYLADAKVKGAELHNKWLLFQVWLNEEERDQFHANLHGYYKRRFDEDKRPPVFVTLEQQYRCRVTRDALLKMYKSPNDQIAARERDKSIWVIPTSGIRETDEILAAWGRTDVLNEMERFGIWPVPPDQP